MPTVRTAGIVSGLPGRTICRFLTNLYAHSAAALGLGATGAAVASSGERKHEHHSKGGEGGDRAAIARLKVSPTTLSQAILAAERQTGGKAMAATFIEENGAGPALFLVEIARNDAVERVTVDGATGQIVKVAPDDQDDDHDHEDDD